MAVSSLATVCTLCILLFASEARAQCTAQNVLQNQLRRLKKIPSASIPQILVKSAADVPVWKTITVGTFTDTFALRNALDSAGCSFGELAGQILARPAFTLRVRKTSVELFAVSAAELGFETDTVSLAAIYARAQLLGYGLAAAEVGPQLRLQYFDQPMGEFLTIGMEPIRTWNGERVIITVANGGAGLSLIGHDGSANAQISVASRFFRAVQKSRTCRGAGGRSARPSMMNDFATTDVLARNVPRANGSILSVACPLWSA